jgi:VWFA-related protein
VSTGMSQGSSTPKVSTKLGVVVVLLCVALLPSTTTAQTTPPMESGPTFSARSNVVLVPALVRTKAGKLVYTLSANDFTLADDGVEQKVTLEQDTDSEPLALVIAVETGGAGAEQLDKYRHLATTIESVAGGAPHKVAVVTFENKPTLLQDFTSNPNVVDFTIRGLAEGNRTHGGAILDALAFSVDLLRQQPPEYRRAILLLSETIDHGSHIKMADALRAISDTNTIIYSVGFSSPKSDVRHYTSEELPTVWNGSGLSNPNPQHPGGCMAKDPNADPDAPQNKLSQAYDCLGQLAPPLAGIKIAAIAAVEGMHRNAPETVAHLTGGEYFPFSSTRNLESALLAISNHIPNRYVLSFQPRSPHPGLHSIELQLKEHPDLVVMARRNYWVDETSGDSPHP